MKLKKQTIQSKILAAVILIELTVSFLLGGISIVSSKNMLLEDATDTLKLTSMKEADKINSIIQQIEQSVDTLSAITLDSIADFNTIIEQVSNAKVYDSGYAFLVNIQAPIRYIIFSYFLNKTPYYISSNIVKSDNSPQKKCRKNDTSILYLNFCPFIISKS